MDSNRAKDYKDYKDFKDIHKGEKIIVCGCGNSVPSIADYSKYITIGVNDISRLFTPNYLVVVNDKTSFDMERWNFVQNTQAPYIFTHVKKLPVQPEKRVLLQLGKYGGTDLNKEPVDYTSNSPYIACIVAKFMGATKIGLIGVDFTPNHFFKKSGDHSLTRKITGMNQEYATLHRAMTLAGVEFVNLSAESKITSLPKVKPEDF